MESLIGACHANVFTNHNTLPQVHLQLPELSVLLLPVQSVPPVSPPLPLPAGRHGPGETGETGQQPSTAGLPSIAHRLGEKRILQEIVGQTSLLASIDIEIYL